MVTHNLEFDINRSWVPSASGTFVMSDHAMQRMFSRSLSPETIRLTLHHGDPAYGDGVRIYRVGKRQIACVGENLREIKRMYVISDHEGTIATVYRNSGFQVQS